MPRSDSKSAHFYTDMDAVHDSEHASSPSSGAAKKKHVCSTCDRAFTTSGHLARHSRVHTGERNHKCPFPGCETRCSRQDNLQQHYRIHLSPGSRRSSTRSAIARAMNQPSSKRSSSAGSPNPQMIIDIPPLSCPPALEPARVYSHRDSPPNSPPPLAQATLPAGNAYPPSSLSRGPSSSPETSYSTSHISESQQSYNAYSNYQDNAHSPGFNFAQSAEQQRDSYYDSHYPPSHHHTSVPHINTSVVHHQHHHQDSPASSVSSSISSRHSISHISHPHHIENTSQQHHHQTSSNGAQSPSYSRHHSAGTAPPSPASSRSASSHTSGPTTPSFASYHDEPQSHGATVAQQQQQQHYHHQGGAMIAEQPAMPTGHHPGHMSTHIDYASTVGLQRFDSPPPVLAPIQDSRRLSHHQQHERVDNSSYVYQSYHHQNIAMAHGAWKSNHSDLRSKGAMVR